MATKILIEPVINDKEHGFAIQAKSFSFGLKIKNCSDHPSPSFTITSINIGSAQGQNIRDDFGGKSFIIEGLNPDQEKILSIGKNGQFMYGLTDVHATITVQDISNNINFQQKNPFTKEVCDVKGVNNWVDFFYIKSSNEHQQDVSTKWIIRLTWATALLSLIQVGSILF